MTGQRDAGMKQAVHELTKRLSDSGRLIESGWIALKYSAVPPDAPEIQIREMRNAFFAGAQHLFSSIMTILDPGEEPTDKDLERMALIESELREFYHDFVARNIQPEGRA